MRNRIPLFNIKFRLFITFLFLTILLGSLFYNKILPSSIVDFGNFKEEQFRSEAKKSVEIKSEETQLTPFTPIIKIIVIADSHLNINSFVKVNTLIKELKNIDLVVHLGDHTDFGDLPSLLKAKKELDNLNTPYVSLPGDRDLAATSSEENFYKVFSNDSFLILKNIKFTFFNNSRNFDPYPDLYLTDFIEKINKSDFLFTSQPIYVKDGNLFSQKYMGSLEAFPNLTGRKKNNLEKYFLQKEQILSSLRKSNISLVVSGDHHRSNEFTDPINKKIRYHIVGATAEKISFGNTNLIQESLQSQRVSLLEINAEKEYKITEVILSER